MSESGDPRHANKRLVSVERQYETDVATGVTEVRIFIKLYKEALESGLLADMPDREWKTLCVIALHMDENGHCMPSQNLIGDMLGLTRQTANERVKALREYRFHGKPVLTVIKTRSYNEKTGTRWAKNNYTVHPISQLRFGPDLPVSAEDETQENPNNTTDIPVSANPDTGQQHTPMSANPDTGNSQENEGPMSANPVSGTPDTKKNHLTTRVIKNVNVKESLKGKGDDAYGAVPTFRNSEVGKTVGNEEDSLVEARIELLTADILEVVGDRQSKNFYLKASRLLPEDPIRSALSETRLAKAEGTIRTNAGAYFTDLLMRAADAHGVDLRSKRSSHAVNDSHSVN